MCVDTANCSGTCGECMSDTIRRLTMANKQLTKMCDQYLAELAAERQRAKVCSNIARVVNKSAKREGALQCAAAIRALKGEQ